MIRLFYLLTIICSIACVTSDDVQKLNLSRPNIIYILADDLGIGDISAYNPQGKIITPNIDALTLAGIKCTDAHSGSSVCSPTRYGILTGRYAWRSRLKSGVTWSWDKPLINDNQTTVASLLKKFNYRTGCVGKWHLGLGWQAGEDGTIDITKAITAGPNTIGFDYFFGITASLDIPPYIYLENNRSTTQVIDSIEEREGKGFWRTGQIGDDFSHEGCLPTLTERAVQFINDQKPGDDPFFLYFPLPAPHTPILPTAKFAGKSGTNEYGDFVLMVDDLVGQIMDAVQQNNLEENTLIIFTSDNGCSPRADFDELAGFDHDPSYIFRGHKADIYEGGHRVPFSVKWPAVIPGGSVTDQTICLTDLLATIASIVNVPLNPEEGVDSYNLLPILKGRTTTEHARPATVNHSINGSFALRKGDWKLIFCPGSGGWSEPRPKEAYHGQLPPLQLYNLAQDPGEQHNLVTQEEALVEELTQLMDQYIREGRSTPGIPQSNDTETELFFARGKMVRN